MHQAPPPQDCVLCGRTNAKPIMKAFDYPPGGAPWNSQPIAMIYTYKCECGLAFTQTVKTEPQPDGKD